MPVTMRYLLLLGLLVGCAEKNSGGGDCIVHVGETWTCEVTDEDGTVLTTTCPACGECPPAHRRGDQCLVRGQLTACTTAACECMVYGWGPGGCSECPVETNYQTCHVTTDAGEPFVLGCYESCL